MISLTIPFAGKKPGKDQPLAPIVKASLDAAERELAILEQRRGSAALAELTGEGGGVLADLQADITSSRAHVANLQAAYQAALGVDDAKNREKLALVRASQVNAVRQHLRARDEASVKLAVAALNMTAAFRALDEANQKVLAALPAGVTPPGDTLLAFPALYRAVQEYLWKVGAGPSDGINWPKAFPGAAPQDITRRGQQDAMPAFDDRVKQTSAFILSMLGKPVAANDTTGANHAA